jgi:hypothetical protein
MSISTSMSSTATSTSQLVKLANGEYTAASVAKDPTDATKLGLMREKDGNYGTQSPSQVATSAASASSSNVQAALTTLKLGGD